MQAVDYLMETIARFDRMDLKSKALQKDRKIHEARALFLLKRAGKDGMNVVELSRALHVTSPFVTQQLNVMQENELIHRTKDPLDGRIVRIILTDKGRDAADEVDKNFRKLLNGLAQHLGEEDTLHLVELLNKSFNYFGELIMERERDCRC